MTSKMVKNAGLQLLAMASILTLSAQSLTTAESYLLGPGDQVTVSLRDRKEIEMRPASVGLDGIIDLQYAGRIQAAGLTVDRLAREIETKLSSIVIDPKVTVEVTQFGSQPVTLLGSVNRPGVHQLQGRKTLVEVLALGEGMKNEAGNVIKITRIKSSGPIPLKNAKEDATGQFTTVEIGAKSLLEAQSPELNIVIRPHDVITIPRAELIYVLGDVRRPGGFPLAERESITVLQALALAEGPQPGAVTQNARILRTLEPNTPAKEVAIDVKKILARAAPDQPLLPNDILFIPNNAARNVTLRVLEAGLQMATGVVIFRR